VFDNATGLPALHCEIGSHIGYYAAVGAAVGAVAGAIVGAVVGAIICVAICLATFGIGAALCLLIVAAAILIGTAADGILGDALGGVAASIADDLNDFDKRGEAITKGCIMTFTGRWITDSNHQHNEMHDISSAQLIDCNDCQNDTTGTTTTS